MAERRCCGAVQRRSVIRQRGRNQIRSISSTKLAFLPARISRQSATPMLKGRSQLLAHACFNSMTLSAAAQWCLWCIANRIDARVRDKLLKRARRLGLTNQDEDEVIKLVEAWKHAAARIDRKHRQHSLPAQRAVV